MQNLSNQPLENELVGMVLRAKEKDFKPSERDVKSMSPQVQKLFQIWNQLQVSGDCLYWNISTQLTATIYCNWWFHYQSENVLRNLHEGVVGGHLGKDKTMERVKEHFCWPSYSKDVTDWARTCGRCAARKSPAPKSHAPLQSIKVGFPMQLVAVDILGPLPTESFRLPFTVNQ